MSTRHHLVADLKDNMDKHLGKLNKSKVKSLGELR